MKKHHAKRFAKTFFKTGLPLSRLVGYEKGGLEKWKPRFAVKVLRITS